jgi:hypothetical protein
MDRNIERRRAYSKLMYEARKREREAIKHFKEQHPERYAELLERAKQLMTAPREPPPRPATHWPSAKTPPRGKLTEEELYKPTERHLLIAAKDTFGDTHTFFESTEWPPPDNEELLEMLNEKHPRYQLTSIASVTPCTCPACITRHGAAQP